MHKHTQKKHRHAPKKKNERDLLQYTSMSRCIAWRNGDVKYKLCHPRLMLNLVKEACGNDDILKMLGFASIVKIIKKCMLYLQKLFNSCLKVNPNLQLCYVLNQCHLKITSVALLNIYIPTTETPVI